MRLVNYTEFRQNLKTHLDFVFTSRSPLFVTRSKGDDVVVISMNDYEGMQETLYLLSSPNNAKRLDESLEEFEQGEYQSRELIEV